ncbi:hypothetical protein LQ50_16475 [Halalkalibacter okhensis]|uniref:VanZ-like domain-containing protein n=1 Tax=Halalkalibacter okhensis TaxID=333138 RepID=A0A0B0IEK8_9BACI|nr:hypothetical protein LQ50_16475 [Halalkalibacter okhensis]
MLNLKSKWKATVLFIAYFSFISFLSFVGISIFFKERLHGNYIEASHNFIPFSTIGMYFLNFGSYNFYTWFYNTLGNILLFIPFGMFLALFFPKVTRVWAIIIILLFSFLIEAMQLISHLGVFDVDDIILKTVGGFLGFLIFNLLNRTKINE